VSLIEARKVSLQIDQTWVLRELSVCVSAGEMIGLIGPNGAGKSTLIKTLGGFLKPSAGEVLLQDKPMTGWTLQKRARQIGYLPQSGQVHWPLTVERAVTLGRTPHQSPWQIASSQDSQAVQTALCETEIQSLAHRRVDTLAGGEKALVLLARVLAGEPAIILADEPVAGLDPNHQLQVMQLLVDRAKKGCAVLVVMHDLSLAARFCKKLLLLKKGQCLSQGTPEEVLTAENLRKGYSVEARLTHGPEGLEVLPWRRL